jgi:polyisoprenyl-teichoic acid--peptidoglycan teichoic acid transferase
MSKGNHRRLRTSAVTIRSIVLPGWGHLRLGRRRVGWTLVTLCVAILAVAVVTVVVVGPTELVAWLVRPGVLVAVLVANAVLAIFRLVPTLHVWSVAGGHRAIAALLVGSVVLAPHAALGFVGYETHRALETVFSAPAPAPTTTTTTTSSPLATTTTAPGTAADASTTSTTNPPTTTTTLLPDPGELRLNVLLLGGDAGPRRSGLRTDTVIVASIDTVTGASALFSLPRNWGGLPLADGSTIPGRIMNEVYEWAATQPDRFPGPDPGASALVEVAESLTGLDIDFFALVDLTGFADVVDAVGGVTIDVPRAVYGPSYDPATGRYTMIRIPSGTRQLDGAETLAYVRERYQSSDYDRMRRQRCVLAALAESADTVSLLRGLRGILGAIETHVTTDVPREEVPLLIRLAGILDTDEIRVVGFDNTWRRGWDSRGFAIPDPERITAAVAETLDDPEAAGERFGFVSAADACG